MSQAHRSETLTSWFFPFLLFAVTIFIWWMWMEWGVHAALTTLKQVPPAAVGLNKRAAHSKLQASAAVPLPTATDLHTPPSTVRDGPTAVAVQPQSVDIQELGQAGDSFGGLNALFAALAFAAVFWAGSLQRRALLETRASIAFDQTQQIFFQMLELARALSDRIRTKVKERASSAEAGQGSEVEEEHPTELLDSSESNTQSRERTGVAAMDSMARTIYNRALRGDYPDLLVGAVERYKNRYESQPSRIGPYLRMLYQIFRLVDEAKISTAQKLQLARVARAQLSEGTVLLLALNALTWRGWSFIPLIERYGLLEHMHPDYLAVFRTPLLAAFQERAFHGSEERALLVDRKGTDAPDPYRFDSRPQSVGTRRPRV